MLVAKKSVAVAHVVLVRKLPAPRPANTGWAPAGPKMSPRPLLARLLKCLVGGGREVGERDAGREEEGGRAPRSHRQEVTGTAAAEHLLGPGGPEDAAATTLARLDQDHEDQEHARQDVHDRERG